MIQSRVDRKNQITIFQCIGKITLEELLEAFKCFYDDDPTSNTLWDLQKADVSNFRAEDVQKIAQFPAQYIPDRHPGKSAVIAPENIKFGLGRMLQTYLEMSGFAVTMEIFRSEDEAHKWILYPE